MMESADGMRALVVLHFLGLAMGFSTGFGNIVMAGIMAKATPDERRTLAKFPPAIARVGDIGLVLLWVTGLVLVFTKWGGFGAMPGLFHAKLTAVVLMTLVSGFVHSQAKGVAAGDPGAIAKAQAAGKVTFVLAVTIVTLAVWTFN
ncbi:MAG: hypothetical protein FJW21_06540 [Acidimicrobiia bacterium]|nr:hypothetical protein [Acidimicrobiia bacterium]